MVLRSLEEFPNLGLLVYPGGDESFWLKKDKAENREEEKGRIPLSLSLYLFVQKENH